MPCTGNSKAPAIQYSTNKSTRPSRPAISRLPSQCLLRRRPPLLPIVGSRSFIRPSFVLPPYLSLADDSSTINPSLLAHASPAHIFLASARTSETGLSCFSRPMQCPNQANNSLPKVHQYTGGPSISARRALYQGKAGKRARKGREPRTTERTIQNVVVTSEAHNTTHSTT